MTYYYFKLRLFTDTGISVIYCIEFEIQIFAMSYNRVIDYFNVWKKIRYIGNWMGNWMGTKFRGDWTMI